MSREPGAIQENNDANRISANILSVKKAEHVLGWRAAKQLDVGIELLAEEYEDVGLGSAMSN